MKKPFVILTILLLCFMSVAVSAMPKQDRGSKEVAHGHGMHFEVVPLNAEDDALIVVETTLSACCLLWFSGMR